MKCCACRGVGSGIASIAILFGLGAAGYNTVRTGCPLGTCCGEACEQTQAAPAPVVAPVAAPAAPTGVPEGVKPVQAQVGSPR